MTEFKIELKPLKNENEEKAQEMLSAFNSFIQSNQIRDSYIPPSFMEGYKAPRQSFRSWVRSLFRSKDQDTPFQI